MSSQPKDPDLYAKVKKQIYAKMPVHSAYRSSHLVKRYKAEYEKKHGGSKQAYSGTSKKMNRDRGLQRWHREQWRSDTGEVGYRDRSSVYRPTKRITKETPRTFSELSEEDIWKAKQEKQKTGKVQRFGEKPNRENRKRKSIETNPKTKPKQQFQVPDITAVPGQHRSNRTTKKKQASGNDNSSWKPVFSKSNRKRKKYSVVTPLGKLIHFGDIFSQHWKDSTGLNLYKNLNHGDPERRRRYLARAGGIRNRAGKLTKDDPEHANYYSIRYLW
jgi:hypothetical protein